MRIERFMLIIFTYIVIVCQKKSGKQTKIAEIFLTQLLKTSLKPFYETLACLIIILYTHKKRLKRLVTRFAMSQAGYYKDWKLSESS